MNNMEAIYVGDNIYYFRLDNILRMKITAKGSFEGTKYMLEISFHNGSDFSVIYDVKTDALQIAENIMKKINI